MILNLLNNLYYHFYVINQIDSIRVIIQAINELEKLKLKKTLTLNSQFSMSKMNSLCNNTLEIFISERCSSDEFKIKYFLKTCVKFLLYRLVERNANLCIDL